jgi:23S rRNA (adenine2503-C2)-methyltransferase
MTDQSTRRRLGDLSRAELQQWCAAEGYPGFRADQIRKWVFGKRVDTFDLMTDLPAPLRARLAETFDIFSTSVIDHRTARDRTEKLLLKSRDGETLECVLMREEDRRTICISTQIGCAMGCIFCASGLLGVKRSLSTGEILEQILRLDRLLPADERITNIVVMGIGEPLANLDNLLAALDHVIEKGGLGMSMRRITISTVGLPEKIRDLARVGKPFNLAVSLHAPNDQLRTELVPVNKNIGIEEVLKAADDYFEISGRRVTYEYILIGGKNDAPEHARQLAKLLSGRCAHVNLIPMNKVAESPFQEPTEDRKREFVRILEEAGVAVSIRKRKGADIDAACGQLRLKHEQQTVAIGD